MALTDQHGQLRTSTNREDSITTLCHTDRENTKRSNSHYIEHKHSIRTTFIVTQRLMTIDEDKYTDSVSPKDISMGTFEPLAHPARRSWSLNKKLCTKEQQSTYGKLASFQFPKEGPSTKESTGAPSLYSSVSSSPSFAGPTTPRGSVGSHGHLHFTSEPSTPPPPPRRGAYYTHRRSTTPLSLSSNESIFTTHPAQSPTSTYNSFSFEGETANATPSALTQDKCDPIAQQLAPPPPPLITQQSEPFSTNKRVRVVEKSVRRQSCQGRRALPLPMIDLDVVSQPLVPREMGVSTKGMVNKLGAGLERFSLSSGSTFEQELGIIVDTDEEDDEEDAEDADVKDVSIVDFLRESMSPRAMSVPGHKDVCMGKLVDVSRVLGSY